VPIIDAAIRARAALANSQLKELEKFIEQCELPPQLRPPLRAV
jgi:hypothetical protein